MPKPASPSANSKKTKRHKAWAKKESQRMINGYAGWVIAEAVRRFNKGDGKEELGEFIHGELELLHGAKALARSFGATFAEDKKSKRK